MCCCVQGNTLRVEIVVAGDGISYPKPGDIVTIHYTGFLPNGKQFDSTKDRGKPLSFRVGNEEVIIGLDTAVSQLSNTERAKVTIPASMAYGERGFPAL